MVREQRFALLLGRVDDVLSKLTELGRPKRFAGDERWGMADHIAASLRRLRNRSVGVVATFGMWLPAER